jgi:hypothetical protein
MTCPKKLRFLNIGIGCIHDKEVLVFFFLKEYIYVNPSNFFFYNAQA